MEKLIGQILPGGDALGNCRMTPAIQSLDFQGHVNLREVREIVRDKIALIGNVNCGLLQTMWRLWREYGVYPEK